MTLKHDRLRRRRLPAAAALAVLVPGPVHAVIAEADPFGALPTLDAGELGTARGGMMINGIPVNFTVVIRSTVGDSFAQGLQTTLTVDDRGGLARAETVPVGASGEGAGTVGTTSGGMTMTLPGGGTIIHQIIHDQLRTQLANTADNTVLSQITEVNVEMPGFTQMSQTWRAHSHAGRLGRDAAMNGLGR